MGYWCVTVLIEVNKGHKELIRWRSLRFAHTVLGVDGRNLNVLVQFIFKNHQLFPFPLKPKA
jgi:hypothetical protein